MIVFNRILIAHSEGAISLYVGLIAEQEEIVDGIFIVRMLVYVLQRGVHAGEPHAVAPRILQFRVLRPSIFNLQQGAPCQPDIVEIDGILATCHAFLQLFHAKVYPLIVLLMVGMHHGQGQDAALVYALGLLISTEKFLVGVLVV